MKLTTERCCSLTRMEIDSVTGDVDSLHGGLLSFEPSLVDRILVDSLCQQQGWMRVYGKTFRKLKTVFTTHLVVLVFQL